MGFAVPLASWFRGPLQTSVRRSVLGPVLAETGWFNAPYLARLVDEHQSGSRDHSTPLWTLLMFEAFLRNVLAGNTTRAEVVAACPMRVVQILDHPAERGASGCGY
jgi:asparagine synthase (glutamine-hydrolysing)